MKIPIGIKKIASLCVLRNGNKFLLLKRWNEPNKGKYAPVGGKLEPFESPQQAAIRECYEETGIEVSEVKYAGMITETSPTKYNWVCYVYTTDIELLEVPYCDEGDLEWVDFDRIKDLPTPKTDWHVYQYILKNQKFSISAIYNEEQNLIEMKEDLEDINLLQLKT